MTESPSSIKIRRVGDEDEGSSSSNTVASAGEDVELECAVSGGNPPARVRWFAGRDPAGGGREILFGHVQTNRKEDGARTFESVSRLTLPVSKSDDGAEVRCVAEHPALSSVEDEEEGTMEDTTLLSIHCE